MDLNIDTFMCLRYHILYVSSIVQKGFIRGHDNLTPQINLSVCLSVRLSVKYTKKCKFSTYSTALDLKMGYCSIRLDPMVVKMCTIILPWG